MQIRVVEVGSFNVVADLATRRRILSKLLKLLKRIHVISLIEYTVTHIWDFRLR